MCPVPAVITRVVSCVPAVITCVLWYVPAVVTCAVWCVPTMNTCSVVCAHCDHACGVVCVPTVITRVVWCVPVWPQWHCDFCVCAPCLSAVSVGSCFECMCVCVWSVCVVCPRGDLCVLGPGVLPATSWTHCPCVTPQKRQEAGWWPDPVPLLQAEVCSGTVADVLQSVVGGADGCIFSFGHASLGKYP